MWLRPSSTVQRSSRWIRGPSTGPTGFRRSTTVWTPYRSRTYSRKARLGALDRSSAPSRTTPKLLCASKPARRKLAGADPLGVRSASARSVHAPIVCQQTLSLIVVVYSVGFAGRGEQFQLVAGAVNRHPKDLAPVGLVRGPARRQRVATEDEDLVPRHHIHAKDQVGRLERHPPLRDGEIFEATPGHHIAFAIRS